MMYRNLSAACSYHLLSPDLYWIGQEAYAIFADKSTAVITKLSHHAIFLLECLWLALVIVEAI
jgi:hypothetical protein